MKVWKRNFAVKPFPITTTEQQLSSRFDTNSCYIVLHLFSSSLNSPTVRDEPRDESNFRMMEQLFTMGSINNQSSNNHLFTPRGLEHPFASSRPSISSPLTPTENHSSNKYQFDLYVWYGKEATDFVKSRTVEKALSLESLLQQDALTEQLFHSGKSTSFDEIIRQVPQQQTAQPVITIEESSVGSPKIRHHLLSRIRSLMSGAPMYNYRYFFEELTLFPSVSDESSVGEEKFNNLLMLRKRPMAGVVTSHEESLESPRKKERTTQLSPLNTRDVEHVEEPKVLSGRELAKACHHVCSKITDFMFLGSVAVAQDKKKLQENGITHIINAASVYCDNFFPNDFSYYSLSLYDDPNESIIGSFYGVVEFIENAIKNGGKVYVHCQMGVSRSCCLCISYMMWKYKMKFNQALEDVKNKRSCCSPNAGFLVQLTQWETILGLNEKSIKEPKSYLYRISPLNNFYALYKELVPKLCHNTRHLDSRTCFLLQCKDGHCYLWIGCQSTEEIKKAADEFIGILKAYSPKQYKEWIELKEGEETDEFKQALETLDRDLRRVPSVEYPDLRYLKMTKDEAMDIMRQVRTFDKNVDTETEKELKQYKNGTLFSFEDGKFNEFDYFDSEDIVDDMCYVMLPEGEKKILVLVGFDVDLEDLSLDEKGEEIGEMFIEWKQLSEATAIQVCEEDDPEFFRYFKNG